MGSNSTTRPKSSLKARLRLWGRTAVHTHRPYTASGRAQPLQDHPSRSLAGKAPRVPRPGWGHLFYPLLPGQGWSCGSAGTTPTPVSTLAWAPLAAGRAPPSRLRLGPQGRTGPGPYVVPPPPQGRQASLPCLLARHRLRAILSNLSWRSQSNFLQGSPDTHTQWGSGLEVPPREKPLHQVGLPVGALAPLSSSPGTSSQDQGGARAWQEALPSVSLWWMEAWGWGCPREVWSPAGQAPLAQGPVLNAGPGPGRRCCPVPSTPPT